MTEQQWSTAWQTFRRAQELPENEREAFVRQAVQDQQIVDRVLVLLHEGDSVASAVSRPAAGEDPAPGLAVGHRLGRYQITRVLGQGGTGDVYAAEDTELHRAVAIKVLRTSGGGLNPEARAEDSFREARAASALNHPNIVTVHEVTREGPTMAIVMELVSGAVLRSLCGNPQPAGKVAQLGQQIAAALDAAHAAGLVHRDVKPENIVIREDGLVKVLDFGLARDFEGAAVTRPDAIPVGTWRYMSPEQIRSEKVGPASDIYALGLVLYEMVAGAHPFARTSALDTMLAIVSSTEAPRLTGGVTPGGHTELETLIARMLCPDPALRPSAAQVAATLNAVERRSAEPVAGRQPGVPPGSAPGGGFRRWLPLVWGACALLASGVWWLTTQREGFESAGPVEAVPFTSETGAESEAAVSPDGRRVAYVSEQSRGRGIFIKNVQGGNAALLSGTGSRDSSPAWSPDGRSIAHLRRVGSGSALHELMVTPSSDGAPGRMVARFNTVLDAGLTWSPDGKSLVVASNEGSEQRIALYAVSLADGRFRRLTDPPADAAPFGDRTPAFSPDGSRLAFSRRLAYASSDVFVVPVNAQLETVGPPRRIQTGREFTTQPAWLPNGRELVVSAGSERERRLIRIGASAGAPASVLAGAGEFGYAPAVGPGAQPGTATLIYTRHIRSSNLYWQPLTLPTGAAKSHPAELRRLAASSSLNEHPHLSADGRKVTFVSDRTGSLQVWSVDIETGLETRWTSTNCPTVAVPRWSFDGRRITYTANCGQQTDVYVVDGPGVAPIRLTDSPALDENSTFSPDGRWVYFTSHRDQGQRIWRVPAGGGGAAEPVTRQVSSLAAFSEDGSTLYFTGRLEGEISLWSMPAAGGDARLLLPNVSFFVPVRGGFIYSRLSGGLRSYRFASGISQPISSAPDYQYVFSAPPSGNSLVISRHDFAATDLMMVTGLR